MKKLYKLLVNEGRFISNRLIDIPLVAVAGALLLLIAMKTGGKIFDFKLEWVTVSFFPLLSVFANLVIWKMVQTSLVLTNTKLNRWNLIAISGLFLFITAYYVVTISQRKFIYYWDYGNYLSKQYELEAYFYANGAKNGLFHIIRSLSEDYTLFINVFTEFPFILTNRTGNSYIFVQLFNIFLPILVIYSAIINKLSKNLPEYASKVCFVLGITVISVFPLLHNAAIKGQPDWFGLIFCGIILLITLDYRFEKAKPFHSMLLFCATACLIITRRWYLYFIVSWYFLYAFNIALDILQKYYNKKQKEAILQGKYFASFVIISALLMGIGFYKIIFHILSYNYAERYAEYYYGGFPFEISNQIHLVGILSLVLILCGLALALLKRIQIRYVISVLLGWFLSIFLFTRVQNMGVHQSLLLVPYYFLATLIGITALFHIRTQQVRNICILIVITATTINVFSNFWDTNSKLPFVADCNVVLKSREDFDQILDVSLWIGENCTKEERAYIIPHDDFYNPTLFRNIIFPDMRLYDHISYGSGVLGTHGFPTELFSAKYVLTCTPFPKHPAVTRMAEKYNQLFLEISLENFELVKTFPMGNGITFYAYHRIIPANRAEIERYQNAFPEENKKFPDLFDDVFEEYIRQHNL